MKWARFHIAKFSCIILLISACTLDPTAPTIPYTPPFECINLPPPPYFMEWHTLFPDFAYFSMCFNPHDPEEIAVFKYDFNQINDSIFRYHLRTGERQLLTNLTGYSIEWSSKDWIIIDGGGIWKIKSNGDSLTYLDLPGGASRPHCNPRGDRIAVSLSLGASSGYHIADLEGHIQDSIQQIAVCDWYADDSILGYDRVPGTQDLSIQIMQASTKKLHYIMPVPQDLDDRYNHVQQMRMFRDHDHAAVLTGNGLWVISTKTKTVRRLATSCDNRRISSIRLTPNGRYIYAEESTFLQVDSITVRSILTTVVIDAETGERMDTIFYAAPK